MSELVPVAPQAAVATRAPVAAAFTTDPVLRSSQAFQKLSFLLQTRHEACPAWNVVIQDDERNRLVWAAVRDGRTKVGRGNFQDMRSTFDQGVSQRVCEPDRVKMSFSVGCQGEL